jgi:hypothetical protein
MTHPAQPGLVRGAQRIEKIRKRFRLRPEAEGDVAESLESAANDLSSLLLASETEIGSLTLAFQQLATQANATLALTSAIVGCIEDDSVTSVLPGMRALGSSAANFLQTRLNASGEILQTISGERNLLRQLSMVTSSQSMIAVKTRILTMMTNVEVGRLGVAGTGFQHLATELAKFSLDLGEQTDELSLHTEGRKRAIEETECVLTKEVPHLTLEMSRIQINLADDLKALESGLIGISAMPAQFRACVAQIAIQITGVIAAIQSHDITRQQIEHVREALTRIASGLRGVGILPRSSKSQQSRAYTGIAIQIAQLQHIRASVDRWTSQIRDCLDGIVKASASDLVDLGRVLLAQEREISAKLNHVDLLERQTKGCCERIRQTVGEHAGLLRLIERQGKKAAAVRQLLHLLSLNSSVEASGLGARANAILEISNGISEISSEWRTITDRSESLMQEIAGLVERVGSLMTTLCEAGDGQLREAHLRSHEGLAPLHAAATLADAKAKDIQLGLRKMQTMSHTIAGSGDVLNAAYAHIDSILGELCTLQSRLKSASSSIDVGCDTAEIEQLYSASYTTEAERAVLQTVLHGVTAPSTDQALGGNNVELF